MFGHRSFLILGDSPSDILNLLKGGLEISNCSFSFTQDMDINGKATSKVNGGVIEITIPQLPPPSIVDWAIDSRQYKNGSIIMLSSENIPIEKVFFENAACIDFEIEYAFSGKDYTTTKFIIYAERIIVGDGITFDNEWLY